MRFLVGQVSSDTYVNIMDQYYPAGKVDEKKYDEINRRINSLELREAYEVASAEGLGASMKEGSGQWCTSCQAHQAAISLPVEKGRTDRKSHLPDP